MLRADLLSLTDDGLIQLSNAGLVKRALRELAAGAGPALEEGPDGAITARFADGVETRLPAGKTLGDANCTCPSSGLCRHRVMLALAYRERGSTGPDAAQPEPTEWDPASIDLPSFEAALGPVAKAELARLLASRIDVGLERGRTPSARLPMATVRFLVPGEVSYARCDCAQGSACAHVALALRAFQAAAGANEATVGMSPVTESGFGTEALRTAIDDVIARLLDLGVTAGSAGHARTLGRARREAEALGAVQALLAIDALAEQIDAYEQRSARYHERTTLALAAELYARTRTSNAAAALGLGETFDTQMTKSRLVSLGARLRLEDAHVRAAVLLADSDTGATMLLEKLVAPLPNEVGRLAETLARRQLAPGLPLAGLGRGQILTSVAKRRADGLLTLGGGSGGRTQLMPRDAIFAFVAPLAAQSVADIVERFAQRPLSFIRPRRRVDDVHVFDVEEVLGQSWTAGSQLWQAAVRLRHDGGTLHLERAFDAAAPGALDVLSAAFDGGHGALRQVAGPVRAEGGALVCEPWSLGADRFVVPDLDAAEQTHSPLLAAEVPPASTLLDDVGRLLAVSVHAGRRARDAFIAKEGGELAAALRAEGYRTMATRLTNWLAGDATDVIPFGNASVWLLALLESNPESKQELFP